MPHRHATIILILIVAGVAAALVSGWIWGEAMTSVEWLGTLFLDTLKMLIIPLVFSAVVSGITAFGDLRRLGRLGGATVAYYVATVTVAVLIGLVTVNLIQPGVGLDFDREAVAESAVSPEQEVGFTDIVLSLVSPNIVDAAAETDILPVIVFAILLASALGTMGEKARPVVRFFDGFNDAMMKIVSWVMYFAPIGIFALVAARLGEAGGGAAFLREIAAVGWHVVTVLTGLAAHFVVLTLVLLVVARRRLGYLVNMLRALVTAFGTASSSATLPLTLEGVRENRVDEGVSRFVLPLGSTVNMDGTALYEAAAVMFIAQAYGVELGLAEQGLVLITATLAAIGAAGIPEAGLVTMVIVLNAVGLPTEGIGLLLAVDWLLDRFRTSVNVWGDSVGAAVVARFVGKTR